MEAWLRSIVPFHLPSHWTPYGRSGRINFQRTGSQLTTIHLSLLYLFYSGMISSFLVRREFSRMKSIRRPLRVSEPLGIQRSSYFISLPLRYGIPLYTTSGMMHWLISQSLFLARITAFFPNGEVDNDSSFSTCGNSPIALFISKWKVPKEVRENAADALIQLSWSVYF